MYHNGTSFFVFISGCMRKQAASVFSRWHTVFLGEYTANIFSTRMGDGMPLIFNGNGINHGSIPNSLMMPVWKLRSRKQNKLKAHNCGCFAGAHCYTCEHHSETWKSCCWSCNAKEPWNGIPCGIYEPALFSVCSMDEIKNICDEIFGKNVDYLGDYR